MYKRQNSNRQSLDEEMKNSNYGNNTFKGVGESHSQLWANRAPDGLSLIHISEPTRLALISYAVFCLKKS
ncbi:hypothetical protein JMUB7546_26860 [Staphylococcus aureus]